MFPGALADGNPSHLLACRHVDHVDLFSIFGADIEAFAVGAEDRVLRILALDLDVRQRLATASLQSSATLLSSSTAAANSLPSVEI